MWKLPGFMKHILILNLPFLKHAHNRQGLVKLMTHLSPYQLVFGLRVWWRIAVGGRDRSPEGTGRGEEETYLNNKEPALAHEEATGGAQVKETSLEFNRLLLTYLMILHFVLHACFVLFCLYFTWNYFLVILSLMPIKRHMWCWSFNWKGLYWKDPSAGTNRKKRGRSPKSKFFNARGRSTQNREQAKSTDKKIKSDTCYLLSFFVVPLTHLLSIDHAFLRDAVLLISVLDVVLLLKQGGPAVCWKIWRSPWERKRSEVVCIQSHDVKGNCLILKLGTAVLTRSFHSNHFGKELYREKDQSDGGSVLKTSKIQL